MISLESSDARDRVTTMRDGLRRAMRALSEPHPRWYVASLELIRVGIAVRKLSKDCYMEGVEHGNRDR